MKIDLHVHTSERSQCARSGEEKMIQAAIAHGIDGLAFTDHHMLVPLEWLEQLNRRYAPFRIFGGIEISVTEGEDLLVLGVHDPALESREWAYPALYDFVREREGFLILAHPFRFRDRIALDLERFPPDAMEIRSNNTREEDETKICFRAGRFGLRLICSSDAHRAKDVGMYFCHLGREPQDERELLDILRAGRYTCHHLDTATALDHEFASRPQLCRV
jgi:histidinol phosphatase-like PHP family hydrolase